MSTSQLIENGVTTTGTVIAMKEKKGRVGYVYRPVVSFQTVDNRTIRLTSSGASYPPKYRVGEQVEVIYDPQEPENAKIKSFESLWLGVVISGAIGLGFLGFSVLVAKLFR